MPKGNTLNSKSIDAELVVSRKGGSTKKYVSWGDMVVYEFPSILGDNPAVSDGAPLTIGWNHENVSVTTIEYNEFLREKRPRRRRKDMILSSAQRDTVSIVRVRLECVR
jgi:hypothetical protein